MNRARLKETEKAFLEGIRLGVYDPVYYVCAYAKVVGVSEECRAVYSCRLALRKDKFTAGNLRKCDKCRCYVPAWVFPTACRRLLEEGLAAVRRELAR